MTILNEQNSITPKVRSLELLVSDLTQTASNLASQLSNQQTTINGLLNLQSATPASPVANLLYNGEIGHSVNSWYDSSYVISNLATEAAWWWTNCAPASKQSFAAIVVADTIPLPSHNYTDLSTCQFTGASLPAPLVINTDYFVIYVDANNIKVASTLALAEAGTAIGIATTACAGSAIQQVLSAKDARDSLVDPNQTLRNYVDTNYDPLFSRWNSQNGWAELTDTKSVDQMLPTNFVDATTTLARVSLIAAKANVYIEIPEAALFGCGIWDNTVGQNCFLPGAVGFSAQLTGTPGTVERRYRILITSDRGFQILSDEITILNGPADGAFSSTSYIAMSWGQQAGQLQVNVYEYLPAGGMGGGSPEYRLLTQISAATSYIHEGAYLETVPGYPTPTARAREASYFTQTGEFADIAINGVSAAWSTVNFPINVPENYNKANTTGRQWMRTWMTAAPNLFIPGCVSDGSTTITIPDGAVNSAAVNAGGYGTGSGSQYAGLSVQVYDVNDALLATTDVASVTSNTEIVLSAAVVAGNDRKVRIVGGGFHGVFIDKIHLGFQQNTSYAPNANDNRTLQPVAAPTSSTQGGVGGGGSGGGFDNCIVGRTPVKMAAGIWKAVHSCRPGYLWAAPGLKPNILTHLRSGFENVRQVRTANGVMVVCTDTECFVTGPNDTNGTPLYRLRVGDMVMTEIDDRIKPSKLVEIGPYIGKAEVFTPTLSETRLFFAGEVEIPWYTRLWYKMLRRNIPQGGFILHNNKLPPDLG